MGAFQSSNYCLEIPPFPQVATRVMIHHSNLLKKVKKEDHKRPKDERKSETKKEIPLQLCRLGLGQLAHWGLISKPWDEWSGFRAIFGSWFHFDL